MKTDILSQDEALQLMTNTMLELAKDIKDGKRDPLELVAITNATKEMNRARKDSHDIKNYERTMSLREKDTDIREKELMLSVAKLTGKSDLVQGIKDDYQQLES